MNSPDSKQGFFPDTPNTLLLLAQQSDDDPPSGRALNSLVEIYYQPFLKAARHYMGFYGVPEGQEPEDIVNEVAAKVFSSSLEGFDRSKGRFRNYLLASLKNHIISALRYSAAQKRGGKQTPADLASVDERFLAITHDVSEAMQLAFVIELLEASAAAAKAKFLLTYPKKQAQWPHLAPWLVISPGRRRLPKFAKATGLEAEEFRELVAEVQVCCQSILCQLLRNVVCSEEEFAEELEVVGKHAKAAARAAARVSAVPDAKRTRSS